MCSSKVKLELVEILVKNTTKDLVKWPKGPPTLLLIITIFNPEPVKIFLQVGDKGKQFLKKYFMDGIPGTFVMIMIHDDDTKNYDDDCDVKTGQKLEDKQVEALAALPSDASFLQKLLVKHRRLIGDFLQNFLQKLLFKC